MGSVLNAGKTNSSTPPTTTEVCSKINGSSKTLPLISPLTADGIYGPRTTNAVEIFQSTFNMPQTGIVDYATWYEISRVYVATAKLA